MNEFPPPSHFRCFFWFNARFFDPFINISAYDVVVVVAAVDFRHFLLSGFLNPFQTPKLENTKLVLLTEHNHTRQTLLKITTKEILRFANYGITIV